MAIVGLRLNDVAERIKDRRITLEVSDSAKEWLANEGWSDQYGARAVARVVRTKLMFPLAKKLLAGTIRYGIGHYIFFDTYIICQGWRCCQCPSPTRLR